MIQEQVSPSRPPAARYGARFQHWRRPIPSASARLAAALQRFVSPLSADNLALESNIVFMRWLGITLCALLIPFLGLPNLPWIYCCLLAIATYNVVFTRLVATSHPAWLIRVYACGFFDILAASVIIILTGGLDSSFFLCYFVIAVHASIRFGR
ncbi:MAG: hypothetical protein ACR2HB_17140, partial [Dehalococcoidia bacterium]